MSILKTEGKSFRRLPIFFSKLTFLKNSFWNTIRVKNCLDADQARHFVGPDLGSNCLQWLSADDISYHAALVRCFAGYHIPMSILKTEGKSF